VRSSGRTVINGPWTPRKLRDRKLTVPGKRQSVTTREEPYVREGSRGEYGQDAGSQSVGRKFEGRTEKVTGIQPAGGPTEETTRTWTIGIKSSVGR